MNYSRLLVDDIGREYERKNLYLKDLAEASADEAKKIRANRKSHPYNVELASYKDKEAQFLAKLKTELDSEGKKDYKNKDVKSLSLKLFQAKRKMEFYADFIELSYDAQLEYISAAHLTERLPRIIEDHEMMLADLEDIERSLTSLDNSKRQIVLSEIEAKKKTRADALDKAITDLGSKYREGIISKKAYKAEKKKAKRSYAEDVMALEYLDEKRSLEDRAKSIKYSLKTELATNIRVLESDISDLRRKTPVEVDKTIPFKAFISALLPGLGQLLNRQYVKACIFAIASIFIYVVAIPYALGFGNYQGNGVAGLISLAEGARKLDKSIIFMIEGIIAIVLLLLAIFLFYISFVDVYKAEKNEIKGIRIYTWFETKQKIEREGFPYLISAPAFLLVTFIVIVPIITMILISFTNMDPSHQSKFTWVGLENYKLIAFGQGIAGRAFWLILGWTLVWTFGATTLAIAIGFILSLIVNQERVIGKPFFRTIYLLPWAVPAFITIMFFSLMVSKGGPITVLIENVFGVALDIKNEPHLTRLALILIQGWLGSAYIFLLSTGILQGIPKDLYEAAEIDGATGMQRTLKITVPLVLFQTAPLLIGQYTFNFNNFSIIYLFNEGGPFNPTLYGNLAGSSDLLISYIYKLTIENQYQAIGAAITALISIVLIFITFLGFKRTKAFKED